MKIKINSVFGELLFEGDFTTLVEAVESRADLSYADLSCTDLSYANLSRANLYCTDLSGADLSRAYLSGANLSRADLYGAILYGADLYGKKIHSMRIFSGLYRYTVQAVLFIDGSRWVRMGCLFYSLEYWEKIGIRESNLSEFPDDGSEKCEERVAAFEFAKAAVLRMKD